jgi:hypothetical protein
VDNHQYSIIGLGGGFVVARVGNDGPEYLARWGQFTKSYSFEDSLMLGATRQEALFILMQYRNGGFNGSN